MRVTGFLSIFLAVKDDSMSLFCDYLLTWCDLDCSYELFLDFSFVLLSTCLDT